MSGCKLLPCPFCGCANIRLLPQPHGFSVNCESCYAQVSPITAHEEQAVFHWNKRDIAAAQMARWMER